MKNTAYIAQLDQHGFPSNSPASKPDISVQTPWVFGMNQKIQARKIRASTGQFHNLSGTLSGTTTFSGVIVENGTISGNLIEGGTVTLTTISNSTISGTLQNNGTIYNGNYSTAQFNGGTFNNGVIGTPSLTGGTLNPGVYQATGSVGQTGSIVYVKTVSPGTTFGTVSFIGGIITAFN